MKKFLVSLFAILLLVPVVLCAKEKEDNRVKVYIFEAGGCPYCEMETEYLKGLSSYKKKFVIVSKQLYVDHVEWKQGKDYDLGVKVATAFNEAGFEDAAYTGTPFVVISDLYAVAGYSEDLESIIDEAYEEGDKDAVACIASGEGECIRPINTEDISDKTNTKIGAKSGMAIAIVGAVALVGAVVYIFKNRTTETVDEEEMEVKEVAEKEVVKKTTTKKTPAKKAATKKAPAKKTTTKKAATKKTTTKKTTTKKK